MKDLLEYIKQTNPNFECQIRGALPEEISKLENLVGTSLPDNYKEFLAIMGHGDGGLDLTFGGTTDITDIIDFYERFCIQLGFKLPSKCVLIGLGPPPSGHIVLMLEENQEPKVFGMEDNEIYGLLAGSFRKLLFQVAFMQFRFYQYPVIRFYSNNNRERQLAAAINVAIDLQFQPLWFSDENCFNGEKKGMFLHIFQFQENDLNISITGELESEVETVGEIFKYKFDLTVRKITK